MRLLFHYRTKGELDQSRQTRMKEREVCGDHKPPKNLIKIKFLFTRTLQRWQLLPCALRRAGLLSGRV